MQPTACHWFPLSFPVFQYFTERLKTMRKRILSVLCCVALLLTTVPITVSVWAAETATLFSSMKTPIDGMFIQNYLPRKEDLLSVSRPDSKEVYYNKTVFPIMPENFLKEYGGIQDENVLSIQTIFRKTEERRKLDEKQRRVNSFTGYNQLFRGIHRRNRRL